MGNAYHKNQGYEMTTTDIEGSILQRDGKTYAVLTNSPAGIVTPEHLEKVARIARNYAIPTIKLTVGQRIALVGIAPGDVVHAGQNLGQTQNRPGDRVSSTCRHVPGTQPAGTVSPIRSGSHERLRKKYSGAKFPAKIKIGISGRSRCCGESHIRDIGLLATAQGWIVLFGGNGGMKPRFGDVVAKNLPVTEALDLIDRLLTHYRGHAQPHERTARYMERTGMETRGDELLRFIPYIPLDDTDLALRAPVPRHQLANQGE